MPVLGECNSWDFPELGIPTQVVALLHPELKGYSLRASNVSSNQREFNKRKLLFGIALGVGEPPVKVCGTT
ncbi:hypothetical protein TNCT_680201 [Trichonephila clavata]|uniref:Uncharacterized protein n=1 Tax=Trichonephila clavata TaxID=2740835 RepID=A0A8X6J4B5_TRICU|nr:hypothetical protein TNCT_680201 [Trichonephila clavata]